MHFARSMQLRGRRPGRSVAKPFYKGVFLNKNIFVCSHSVSMLRIPTLPSSVVCDAPGDEWRLDLILAIQTFF